MLATKLCAGCKHEIQAEHGKGVAEYCEECSSSPDSNIDSKSISRPAQGIEIICFDDDAFEAFVYGED